MPDMAVSPPPTPSLLRKRNFTEFNLGESMLSRPAKAQRTYFGIDIHHLLEEAQAEDSIPKEAYDIPTPPAEPSISKKGTMLWTEKYRAKKFTDLIGDERTHRSVMHWLKRWDHIVFPGSYRPHKQKTKASGEPFEEKPHRKLLLLTGPPGLENVKGVDTTTVNGKVRKAGKPVCVIVDEVDGVVGGGGGGGGEGGFIKALIDLIMLDQRNSALGSLQQAPARKKKGDRFRLQRPLILICNDIYHPALRLLRQSSHAEVIHVRKPQIQTITTRMHDIFAKEGVPCEGDGVRRLCEAAWGVSNRKEDRGGNGAGEGDMRGIMVVCEWVAAKLRSERHITGAAKLTRRWVEDNILRDLSHGGGAVRGMGRGGPKDIVDRVFQEGAGFPKSSANMPAPSNLRQGMTSTVKGVAEGLKRTATDRLRELVDTHGDTDRIMSDCFASYPDHPFQDDTIMSKPDAAYEWLHFHDRLSKLVHTSSEWELAPYLSTPVLAFHHLFASPTRAQYANNPNNAYGKNEDVTADPTDEQPHPFAGPQASWAAHEATKHNESLLQSLQTALSLDLTRLFSSTTDIATDLLPYLLRMLTPNVTPVIVGGSGNDKSTASVRKSSEQILVARAVVAMVATGVRFERTRVTSDGPAEGMGGWQQTAQWIYRMEPSIDVLGEFFAMGGKVVGESGGKGKQRFAVRQVLEQEWRKEEARRAEKARQARFTGGIPPGGNAGADIAMSTRDNDGLPRHGDVAKVRVDTTTKRDFFGRALAAPVLGAEETAAARTRRVKQERKDEGRVWVSFHEGYSNAVRKGIGLGELMGGL
ncbi:Chromosome transmission fidelity protein 18 [Friedmanniomyces endolithicus]|nr:Chromosome transmission fidelity protein 18 [Friedmanniomyces endolithicus]